MNIYDKKKPVFEKLHKAVKLELSTIPPYLMAMYSIKEGKNVAAASAIRSVFMQEMLHMILAANTLSALEGKLTLDRDMVPVYPLKMDFRGEFRQRDFEVHLEAFSKKSIQTFMRIELPDGWEDPFGLKTRSIEVPAYSIGEFYNGIKDDLRQLCETFGEKAVFSGNPSYQISEEFYWGGGGKPIVVTNLEQALKALDVIIDQGEGTSGSIGDGDQINFGQPEEVAHYFRFNEIYMQRCYRPGDDPKGPPGGDPLPVDYTEVYPIKTNCKSSDFIPGSYLSTLNQRFNENYTLMLIQLAEGFNGNPRVFYTAIMNGMRNLSSIAKTMVQLHIPGDKKGRHAAPSFEWVDIIMPKEEVQLVGKEQFGAE